MRSANLGMRLSSRNPSAPTLHRSQSSGAATAALAPPTTAATLAAAVAGCVLPTAAPSTGFQLFSRAAAGVSVATCMRGSCGCCCSSCWSFSTLWSTPTRLSPSMPSGRQQQLLQHRSSSSCSSGRGLLGLLYVSSCLMKMALFFSPSHSCIWHQTDVCKPQHLHQHRQQRQHQKRGGGHLQQEAAARILLLLPWRCSG